ncbi:Inner membrane transport protein YnfM [Neomoorella glycerini]|uniref:Inner membrane transport protein YnfM n=1 Tax=Neomoorella glycerini TaxID=55779 RepID=A0A6I5ZVG9_9FIRM|nr:MFS transporter [Moorella glycerini]QGP93331.1 Inner membrane transport protein YnfM [Moorella glycerini]
MKRNTLILILGLAGFTVMADNWVVSPILPAIARSLNIEPVRAGLLITAYMIPFGLFQLIFGPLADRYGKRQVVNLAMALFTVGTGLSALGFSLTGLAAYRALTGIFAASVMPISLALIGDVVPLQERQAAIGTFMGISFLGQGLSMAIGGTIAYFLSWRGVFAAYAILALVSTLLLYTLGSRIPSVRNPRSQFFAPYLRLLSNSTSAPVYLVVLLEGILIVGSFSYLGAYIAQTYHYNNFVIGLIMTAFGIAAVLSGRASGPLAARWGRRPVLLAGLLAAAVADVLFWTYGWQLFMLILGVALLGLGFMLAHSTLLTIATEFAARARGTAMSLVAFAFMGGGGVGTAIGGRLIHAFNFSRFFALYALCLFLLIILAALVVRFNIAAPARLEPTGDTP